MHRTRDWRRFQRARMLHKRRRYFTAVPGQAYRMAKTPRPCSCLLCKHGDMRRWRAMERAADQDIYKGDYEDFDSMDDFIASL